MTINSIRRNVIRRDINRTINRSIEPSKKGAAGTAGTLGATTLLSWSLRPDEMKKVVGECGGKAGYAKKFVFGLALFSVIGALTNAALSFAEKKAKTTNPPRAAN